MNDIKKEDEKNTEKDMSQFGITNLKDFEIKKEISLSYEYIKIYKVLRNVDKKYYILIQYPLNIITNYIDKLEKISEIIIIFLKKINHINVLSIKESFIDKSKPSVIMILELYDNKTIQNSILSKYKLMKDKYIPESTLLDYLNNIIEGLSILHKNNIFNINLDPQNIYIDDKLHVLYDKSCNPLFEFANVPIFYIEKNGKKYLNI